MIVKAAALSLLFCLGLLSLVHVVRAGDLPDWAYPFVRLPPPDPRQLQADKTIYHVPGSTRGYTRAQILSTTSVPDWHPMDHPPMPTIVAKGRMPQIRACAYCHMPNGAGRPENASLAGLAPAYMTAQVINFRNGAHKGSSPKGAPQTMMAELSRHVTDKELKEAVAYFARLKHRSYLRVIETDVVPKSRSNGGMMIRDPKGATEPIANRILEMPDNTERTELRDDKATFTAYVPRGSIRKGRLLVRTGGGKTEPCASCHGTRMQGAGNVPRIAGRSPSYIMRQLYEIKMRTRNDPGNAMRPIVARLENDDMLAISAYLASLP